MTSETEDGWIKLGMMKFPKPDDDLAKRYQNLRYKHIVDELNKIERSPPPLQPDFEKEKKYLLTGYASETPDKLQIEDDDGTDYPKQIPLPAAIYVQFAEPHVMISDWSEEVKPWYHFRELIQELEKQAFVTYYQGTYFASFMCSVSCLEYILKYEYIRKTRDESILQNNLYTFGGMVKNNLGDINLSPHKAELEHINDLRNGFFHLNTSKMKRSVVELRTQETKGEKINIIDIETDAMETLPMDKKYHEDNFSVPENEDMSKISFHVYSRLNKITDELYGPKQQVAYAKECIKDYETRYMKN